MTRGPWPPRARACSAGFALLLATGCGGGLPLLHPAQTLPVGDVRASAGLSANAALFGFADATHDAQSEAAANPSAPDVTYAKGALVAASVGAGIAPLVGARVGIGHGFEGGLEYTGRSVRADVRRSFEVAPHLALSIGAGGSAALYGHSADQPLPGVDLGQMHGWGGDLPVLFGYASDGDLYMVWIGARGGGEHVEISTVRSEPDHTSTTAALTATRFWAGGLVGLAVGFRHVHVAMELDAAYANVSGAYAGIQAQVAGLTLAPSSALWWTF